MTDKEFDKDFDNHCRTCQKCMHGAWCVEYLANINQSLMICRQEDFKKEKKKVSD